MHTNKFRHHCVMLCSCYVRLSTFTPNMNNNKSKSNSKGKARVPAGTKARARAGTRPAPEPRCQTATTRHRGTREKTKQSSGTNGHQGPGTNGHQTGTGATVPNRDYQAPGHTRKCKSCPTATTRHRAHAQKQKQNKARAPAGTKAWAPAGTRQAPEPRCPTAITTRHRGTRAKAKAKQSSGTSGHQTGTRSGATVPNRDYQAPGHTRKSKSKGKTRAPAGTRDRAPEPRRRFPATRNPFCKEQGKNPYLLKAHVWGTW